MADKIGYYPSIIFGNYVADETKTIHDTHGECFDAISVENLVLLRPFPFIDAVKREINDGDSLLEGYILCPKCCNG